MGSEVKKLVKFFQGDKMENLVEEKVDRRAEKNRKWTEIVEKAEKAVKESQKETEIGLKIMNLEPDTDKNFEVGKLNLKKFHSLVGGH